VEKSASEEKESMRACLPALMLVGILSGCTTEALNHESANQVVSLVDMRYQEMLDNLAFVAHNNGVLPSFCVTDSGVASVADMINLESKTTWLATGFSTELLNIFGKRNPELYWTIYPAVSEPQLKALWYASYWALYGPLEPGSEGYDLLRGPLREDVFPPPGVPFVSKPHFDVVHRLNRIMPGWVHIGCRRDVDACACYKSHCGDTYVWVNPDGLESLSTFTLVVLDLATTLEPTIYPKAPTATVQVCGCSDACKCNCESPNQTMPPTQCAETGKLSLVATENWRIFDDPFCTTSPPAGTAFLAAAGDYCVELPYTCRARGVTDPRVPKLKIVETHVEGGRTVREVIQQQNEEPVSQPVIPIVPSYLQPQMPR
jgi:hypothetical protein